MPTLVLLAGPNRAGKTTFLLRVLRQWAEAQNPPPSGEGDRVFAVEGAGRRPGI